MSQIDETKIFSLPCSKVLISKDLPRRRKDMGEIQKMMDSIKQFGQLQPIVINRNNELIYGGRRLAACTLLNIPVRTCYKDTLDPLLMRELEIEENIQRKAFTPAEECLAIEELVLMKQKKYGKPTQGQKGGYTLENAAVDIGKTKGTVIEAMQIADMVKAFPDLAEAKSKSEIKKTYKGLQRVSNNISALSSYEKKVKKTDPFLLYNEDMQDNIIKQKDKQYDLIFTDAPYGVNIHSLAMTVGGHTAGKNTTTGFSYDDSTENALNLIKILAKEGYRITKDDGHMYLFCGRDRKIFNSVYDIVTNAGWDVLQWPMIWVKMSSGQNNQPEKWPSSAYEAILFARKPLSKLKILGRPDWVQCDIVTNTKRIHQAEKPVKLCKDLISRVAQTGQKLYDPFCGSGAIIEAGCDMKLFSVGCEKELAAFAGATKRLLDWNKINEK